MPSRAMVFTTRSIAVLKPQDAPYEVFETGGEDAEGRPLRGSGLRLRIGTTGAKTFRWPCTSLGKVYTLGTFGDGTGGTLTLADAHRRLAEYKAKVKAGVDPEGAEADERPRTVKQLAALFYRDSLARRRKRPESAKWVLDQKIIPVIGNVPLVAVDTLVCRRPVSALVDDGLQRSAAVALALEKQLFGFAVELGLLHHNPALPLKPATFGIVATKRDRFLDADELLAVLKAIEGSAMEPAVQLGLQFLILTGLRTNEALSLEWRDVDLEARTVTVRPENMKLTKARAQSQPPYVVPLSPPAVLIVQVLRELAPASSKWVFSSPWSKSGRVDEKALARAMHRLWKPERKPGQEVPAPALTIPPATPHDFRRTLSTHLSDTLGLPPHIGQICLGHSLNQLLGSGVAGTYDRSNRLDERRAALEAYALWIAGLEATGS